MDGDDTLQWTDKMLSKYKGWRVAKGGLCGPFLNDVKLLEASQNLDSYK